MSAGELYRGDCAHPRSEAVPSGALGLRWHRMPLRYGSAECEICGVCGSWRTLRHRPGPWAQGPYRVCLEASRREQEDY